MSRVVSIKQSPVNTKRWSLALDCGHQAWHASKRKPTLRKYDCITCIAQDKARFAK